MRKRKALAAMLAVMAMSLMTFNAHADTDGTELQVAEPSQLTIQLGPEWAGVEFQLRTDSGVYPGTVMVDESGVLSLEIGGSSTYELSCLGETDLTPTPTDSAAQPSDEGGDELTVYGIPVVHLAIFGGGLLAAIVLLIALRFSRRRRRCWDEYDEDDDELSD